MNRVADDPSARPALIDLAFHILIALGNGPAHGYSIGKDVDEQSGGRRTRIGVLDICAYLRTRARGR